MFKKWWSLSGKNIVDDISPDLGFHLLNVENLPKPFDELLSLVPKLADCLEVMVKEHDSAHGPVTLSSGAILSERQYIELTKNISKTTLERIKEIKGNL